MRRTFQATLGGTLALLFLIVPAFVGPVHADDARAHEIADRVLDALGGAEAWEQTRYLTFDFVGRRSHSWDRYEGRYRLEGQNREGQQYVVLMDLDDKQGRAWQDGEEVRGEALDEMLENAWAAWVNDTYWLLAPYKLRDPGVNLSWDGEETLDGKTYDKLLLTFGEVGLTPGDRYWIYVNRETSMVDRWAYVLESQDPDTEPTVWRWEGWDQYGAIQLAPGRFRVGDDRELSLAPIAAPATLPDAVFETVEGK
ncbi:MAG: hypothetical protein AAF604_05045 [Acidobacteriota bacterium]